MRAFLLGTALIATSTRAAPVSIAPTSASPGAALPLHIGGRFERTADGYKRQWPGTYFETAFRGRDLFVKIGDGDVILRVSVDAVSIAKLIRPKPGLYRIEGLSNDSHSVRVEVVCESQAAPTVFGGFFSSADTRPLPVPARDRSRSSAIRIPSGTAISLPSATAPRPRSGRRRTRRWACRP